VGVSRECISNRVIWFVRYERGRFVNVAHLMYRAIDILSLDVECNQSGLYLFSILSKVLLLL